MHSNTHSNIHSNTSVRAHAPPLMSNANIYCNQILKTLINAHNLVEGEEKIAQTR